MSDEFESTVETRFTSFIPLTILLGGLIIWLGYQDFELNKQRSNLAMTYQNSLSTLQEAQNLNAHYLKLIQDLDQTAKDDDLAKGILNDMFSKGLISEAVRAGLIHVQPNATNGTNTPAAPAADTGTK
jgi:hypothetical protein